MCFQYMRYSQDSPVFCQGIFDQISGCAGSTSHVTLPHETKPVAFENANLQLDGIQTAVPRLGKMQPASGSFHTIAIRSTDHPSIFQHFSCFGLAMLLQVLRTSPRYFPYAQAMPLSLSLSTLKQNASQQNPYPTYLPQTLITLQESRLSNPKAEISYAMPRSAIPFLNSSNAFEDKD